MDPEGDMPFGNFKNFASGGASSEAPSPARGGGGFSRYALAWRLSRRQYIIASISASFTYWKYTRILAAFGGQSLCTDWLRQFSMIVRLYLYRYI